MFRTPSKTDQAKDAVASGAEKVTDGAQVAAEKVSEGAQVAAEKASEAAEVAREAAETVKEYAHEAAETLAPKVEHARETFVEDVLPKIASALAAIAAGAAAAKESAAEAADRAPDAYAVLKGDAVAKKGGKGKWILLLGAIAAGAAVMAWRKSNERPDPWATAGSYTPPKPVSEKVSDLAGAAKEKAADVKDAAVEKAGELKGKAVDGKDAAADKAAGAKGAAADKAADVKDAAADAADDLTDAADEAADDTAVPAVSETSEGADLSTPNLDSGSNDGRQGLTHPPPSTTPAAPQERPASASVAVSREGDRSDGQAVAEREQRVVVARHVLGVRPHLVHRARQVEGQPTARGDRRGERLEQGVVAGAVAGDHGVGDRQDRREHRRPVEHDVDDERADGGDALQPHDQPRREVERAGVEPRLEEEVRARLERRHQAHERHVGVLRTVHGDAVPGHHLAAHVLGVDAQARPRAGGRRRHPRNGS